jgi:uncharacterized membrane protein
VAVDDEGTPRVIYPSISFDRFLTISFKHIRHYGGSDPFVCRHMVRVLEAVHNSVTNVRARAAVAEEARMTVAAITAAEPLPADLAGVRMAASWAYVEDESRPPVVPDSE